MPNYAHHSTGQVGDFLRKDDSWDRTLAIYIVFFFIYDYIYCKYCKTHLSICRKEKRKRTLEKKEKIEPLYLDITVMVCPIILHYL